MARYVREPTAEERAKLQRLARSQTAPVRLVRRAEIILRSAERQTVPAIARRLGLAERTVRVWVERFTAAGLEGLDDAPRSGRPRTYTEAARLEYAADVRIRAGGLSTYPADADIEKSRRDTGSLDGAPMRPRTPSRAKWPKSS